MTALRVLRPGPLTTIQDLGRPGYAHLGVTRSGAADRVSLALANRLVGNDEGAPALEVTLGGLSFEALSGLIIALAGAPAPATSHGRQLPRGTPCYVAPGDVVTLGFAPVGLRTYLAIAGGVGAPATLGSASTDTLSGLGPARLASGVELALAGPAGTPMASFTPEPFPTGPRPLRLTPGPRLDWLADPARLAGAWAVETASDRVGVRLSGTPLRRADGFVDVELESEGVVRGAVQVPPSGQPVIFLADHPVTGGYPVVAVVADADTDVLAQARPGERIALIW